MSKYRPDRRINPKPSIIPKAVREGTERCPGCSAVVPLTPRGQLREHRAPSGEDCAVRVISRKVVIEDLPPVNMHTLPAKGECHDCGKWVPNERRFCGQCALRRERNR